MKITKDDWLLKTDNNKSFFIAWLVYIPLIFMLAFIIGAII